MSAKKEESLEATKRKENLKQQKNLEKLLKEANGKFIKENNKFEHLLMSIERLKDKYENEYHRHNEQYKFIIKKVLK